MKKRISPEKRVSYLRSVIHRALLRGEVDADMLMSVDRKRSRALISCPKEFFPDYYAKPEELLRLCDKYSHVKIGELLEALLADDLERLDKQPQEKENSTPRDGVEESPNPGNEGGSGREGNPTPSSQNQEEAGEQEEAGHLAGEEQPDSSPEKELGDGDAGDDTSEDSREGDKAQGPEDAPDGDPEGGHSGSEGDKDADAQPPEQTSPSGCDDGEEEIGGDADASPDCLDHSEDSGEGSQSDGEESGDLTGSDSPEDTGSDADNAQRKAASSLSSAIGRRVAITMPTWLKDRREIYDGWFQSRVGCAEIYLNELRTQTARASSRQLRKAMVRFARTTVGARGEASPRVDARKLITEIVIKRMALHMTRKEEKQPQGVVFCVDVSGSCTAFYGQYMRAAAWVVSVLDNVHVLVHENGSPIVAVSRKSAEVFVGVDRWGGETFDFFRRNNITTMLAMGDDDAFALYNRFAREFGRVIQLDHYASACAPKPYFDKSPDTARSFATAGGHIQIHQRHTRILAVGDISSALEALKMIKK